MDEDTREVATIGCGTCLGVIVSCLILWAAIIYGIIAVINAIQH